MLDMNGLIMRRLLFSYLTVGLLAGSAMASSNLNAPISIGLFLRDDDDYFVEEDLSFITKMAAIGDSYSAGSGAGNVLTGKGDIHAVY